MYQRGACLRRALHEEWQVAGDQLVVGVQHAHVPVARHPQRQVAQPGETEITLQENGSQRGVFVESPYRPQELLRAVAGGVVDYEQLCCVTGLLEAGYRIQGAAQRPRKIGPMVPVRNEDRYAVLRLALGVRPAQARVGENAGLYTIGALQYFGLRQGSTPRSDGPPAVHPRRRSPWRDYTSHRSRS